MFRTLKKLKDLLETQFGASIKNFFIDDPNLIPLSELPCICVAPVSSGIDIADNQRDKFAYTIDICLIINAKQELMKYKKEVVGTQYLTEIMEARDSDGILKANTISKVLRDNLDLGPNWNIDNIGSIDYSLRTRGTVPDSFVTKEAICRLSITEIRNR